MSRVIGSSFYTELQAAQLTGLPFSWGEDGVFGLENLTEEQRAGVEAVLAVHNPSKPAPVAETPVRPRLYASAGVVIVNGIVTMLELAAQLASAYYEEGWMTLAFAQPQEAANYLVFVQTDVPAKIEQFKDLGSFELIFSDPATGDPIEPGRIDLQILKVR